MKSVTPAQATPDDHPRLDGTGLQARPLHHPAAWIKQVSMAGDVCSWNRFVGTVLLTLVVLLFLSGLCLALYYSPVPGMAYDSVDYTLFDAPFGSIVKGVHHYAWNLLLVLTIIHLARSVVAGAYRRPRQSVWISGLAILGLLPLFIITGDLLPWDQKGYWSTQVRLSIIASVPFIGETAVRILQGGARSGIVALTRFYVLHILLLPGLLVALIAVHLYFIARHGLAERLRVRAAATARIGFWPQVVKRGLIIFLVTTVAVGAISYWWPPPLGDPADPTDATYVPKPEWWVLFLNQLVAIFRGPWAVVGTTVIPGLLTVFMLALPFLDRSSGHGPRQRKAIVFAAGILAAIIVGLSVMGYLAHFGSPPE
jgi:ubiquinol-cytochrome c reductase cytochrome b subunit